MKRRKMILLLLLVYCSTASAQVQADRVQPIARGLETYSQVHVPYQIIDDAVVNAFADHQNQKIIVHAGLLGRLTSDDELAFIVGHEQGHFIAFEWSEADLGALRKQISAKLGEPVSPKFVHEYLADMFGVMLCDCAGYDPYAAIRAVENMGTGGIFEAFTNLLEDVIDGDI